MHTQNTHKYKPIKIKQPPKAQTNDITHIINIIRGYMPTKYCISYYFNISKCNFSSRFNTYMAHFKFKWKLLFSDPILLSIYDKFMFYGTQFASS